MKRFLSINTTLLLLCGFLMGSNSQQSASFIERLNKLNHEVQRASSESDFSGILPRIWQVLDEATISYLNQHPNESVQLANRGLEALLETTTTDGWSSEVDLYSPGKPDLLVGAYTYFYTAGSCVTTFHVFRRSAEGWQVVGRMEESSFVKSQTPAHRAEARAQAKQEYLAAKNRSPMDHPISEKSHLLTEVATTPLQANGISIVSQSVQPLDDGGLQFTSTHLPRYAVSEPTVVKWEWTPSTGLKAVAWVWADQWTYDVNEKSEVAEWQTADRSKKGTRVRLRDISPLF